MNSRRPANPMTGLWPASVGLNLPISNTGAHTDIPQFQYFPRSKTIYGGLNGVGGGNATLNPRHGSGWVPLPEAA